MHRFHPLFFSQNWAILILSKTFYKKCHFEKIYFLEVLQEIVFCWNNCSCYSQEKCFKCNLVFPKLSRLKKGQRVKGFWSQGRKKGTEGKVFEAEAVGRGWEMFPEVPIFLPRLQNVYELPFFSTKMRWDKSNYTKIIFSVEFTGPP